MRSSASRMQLRIFVISSSTADLIRKRPVDKYNEVLKKKEASTYRSPAESLTIIEAFKSLTPLR